MGKATRWFKGLLGMKKVKERESLDSSSSVSSEQKERKRWSFGMSGRESHVVPPFPASLATFPAKEAARVRSYLSETEREQSKHAIAVAAATAAAADAAVAAAQAAVAVVRLTSQGRGRMYNAGREEAAAIKIQTVFRGYLARKALRALRALVKLQALVRGYLVRKRATATLRSMHALIRAQNAIRSQRARRSFNKENRVPENRPRKSIESEFHSKRLSTASYEMNSFDESPKIVEIETYKPHSRSRRFALTEYSEDFPYQAISSPFPCPIPTRISIPNYKKNDDLEWYFDGAKYPCTVHNTPRFMNATRASAPITPSKSVSGDSYYRSSQSNCPNYMASTQSFKAKSRSHSAPKQRPEIVGKRGHSLDEILASRNSISSIRMQRHCSHVDEELFQEEV